MRASSSRKASKVNVFNGRIGTIYRLALPRIPAQAQKRPRPTPLGSFTFSLTGNCWGRGPRTQGRMRRDNVGKVRWTSSGWSKLPRLPRELQAQWGRGLRTGTSGRSSNEEEVMLLERRTCGYRSATGPVSRGRVTPGIKPAAQGGSYPRWRTAVARGDADHGLSTRCGRKAPGREKISLRSRTGLGKADRPGS